MTKDERAEIIQKFKEKIAEGGLPDEVKAAFRRADAYHDKLKAERSQRQPSEKQNGFEAKLQEIRAEQEAALVWLMACPFLVIGVIHTTKIPSERDDSEGIKVMEAAGIEPASENVPRESLHTCQVPICCRAPA